MSELAAEYIRYISSVRRFSVRTQEIYSSVLSSYEEFSDSCCEASGDRLAVLRAYVVYLLDDKKMSPRTANLHLSVLSGFFTYLVGKGLVPRNPVSLLTRPKVEKRLPEFYREDSLREWLQSRKGTVEYGNYNARLNYMIVSILMGTGIRRSELIGLNVGDVDLQRCVLHVRGKGDKMREIPLVASLCDEISIYLSAVSSLMEDAYDPHQPLLRTKGGAMLYPVLVDRAVKGELESVPGITGRKSPHVLRHTLATELLDAGTDLNSIKELLGHSSLAATQVYTHNSIERLQKVYKTAHPRAKKGAENGD